MSKTEPISRRALARDLAIFQGKLFIDGLRDLLLVPVSLIAALLDWLHLGGGSGTVFYEVVRLGRRSERWIDLFAAADRIEAATPGGGEPTLDELLERIERGIIEQYAKNGGRLGAVQLHEVLTTVESRLRGRARGDGQDVR